MLPASNDDYEPGPISTECATPEEDHECVEAAAVDQTTWRWSKGKLLGQGAFGAVYKAMNLDTGTHMAVKQVCIWPVIVSRYIYSVPDALGPLIVESLQAENGVSTRELKALDNPLVVETTFWESGWVHSDTQNLLFFM